MADFINFNAIIGNGKSYQVPIYQRDYSWEREYLEDLWNDILELPQNNYHYMGYLVVQPIDRTEEKQWIIDGQQRITTLSIFTLAVIALMRDWAANDIESENNNTRADLIIQRYIGNYSVSRLALSPKLILNRNNDDFYQSYLVGFRTKSVAVNKLRPSQKLLKKAFDYFFEVLSHKFAQNKSGADLASFLETTVGNGLIFTVIKVENDLDAYKVFETLNARGVKLSTADLLKNYLFSQAAKLGTQELDEAERRWQNITDSLKASDLTTFIRHYWNSKYELERNSTLFKAIRRKITNATEAFELLDSLEQNSSRYAAFNDPNDELWDKDERKYLRTIKLLEISTCYSLMLSALEHLPKADFKILLREIVAISFRYNVSALNPNEAERVFSNVAIQLSKNKSATVREVILQLKSIYVTDDNFEYAFSSISLQTRRRKNLVKYILVQLENQLSGSDVQYEDANSSIEHILPENPSSIWEQNFPHDIQQDYIHRLGNYTLLETSKNQKMANDKGFNEKKAIYQTSIFQMTNTHLNYEVWSPDTLILHQEQMAKWAKSIWKSSFL